MTLWEAALLGVVQGLTEFLPISSTAHLLVVRRLLGHPSPDDAFTTVVQLGTLVAVLAYFRSDIIALIRAVVHDVVSFKFATSPESRLAWLIVLGTIPVVIVGGLWKKWLKANFYDLPTMGVVAIVFALLMAAAELLARYQRRTESQEKPVTWWQALGVGCWQAMALMPGASRSGTTITGGLFFGLTRPAAARFSFLLSLPSVFAAGAKELYDDWSKLTASADDAAALGVGLIVAGIVGYIAIAGLLRFLQRYNMFVFVGYRLILGGLLIWYFAK